MERSELPRTAAEKHRHAEVQQIITILHKWGIHTLGQLAVLDKEQLGVRLGPEAIRMWDRANGQCNRVLKLVRPAESFEESFEFENEIETAEPLLFMLRRFLEQLAVRLGAVYLVAKELRLRITFTNSRQDERAVEGKQIYERIFKIPQPTNEVDLLFRMLQTHLENFKSKYPIVAVALNAHPSRPAREEFGLFETILRNPHQLSETLARLIALLGADRVGTPVLEETHRPDAFRMEPFCSTGFQPVGQAGVSPAENESITPSAINRYFGRQDARLPHSQDGCAPVFPALRRFRPAASSSVLLDEDIPAHVRSAEIQGKVIDPRGPYFLSGNWWDEKSWARAEWDLQLDGGEIVRCHETDSPSQSYSVAGKTWKVDGIYD